MAEKKMIIDGVSCPFTTERNVLEVARNNGIDIPSLCYCENLSIYGGCRLCLVENDRGKMDAACSMQPRDGMVVNTHTKQVLDSRRTTLQLLMSSCSVVRRLSSTCLVWVLTTMPSRGCMEQAASILPRSFSTRHRRQPP